VRAKLPTTVATDLIYGLHAVLSLLARRPESVQSLTVQAGRHDARLNEILELARTSGIAVREQPARALTALTGGAVHQGVVAEVRAVEPLGESALPERIAQARAAGRSPLVLVLDGISDPHNLGACLRTADAAGVDAVVAPRDRAAGLTATVRKVAAGAAETVPFVQVTNLARCLDQLKALELWIIGAAADASISAYAADFTVPTALVLGSEGRGLRRLTREGCDSVVHLPLLGTVGSLNVSVATGVLLYEVLRQRGAKLAAKQQPP
jgi:23S rRNA (guanosine2251-2'-O)-methyltransferase